MKVKTKEGAQFVRYFGPLLDALRQLGGSATPSEASSQIADNLKIPQAQQDELLDSGSPRFHNQVQFARLYLERVMNFLEDKTVHCIYIRALRLGWHQKSSSKAVVG